jgi:hypothetical protein
MAAVAGLKAGEASSEAAEARSGGIFFPVWREDLSMFFLASIIKFKF